MFNNLKIGKRLAFSFSIVGALLILIVILSYKNFNTLDEDIMTLVYDKFPKVVWANKVIENINLNARCNRNILLYDKVTQKAEIEKEFKRIADAREEIDKLSDSLKVRMTSEIGKKLYTDFEKAKTEYRKDAAAMRKCMDEAKWDEAKELLFKEVRVSQLAYMEITNKIIEYQTDEVNKVGKESDEIVGFAITLILTVGIVAILLAIFIAIWITKSITKPINGAVDAADLISKGNFTINLDTNSKDETGILIASMKKMKDTIADMVGDAKMLAKAAVEGKLDTRADASKYQGEFHALVSGVNQTLDAVIGPLNVAAEYVDRISKGDIPPRITDQYNGDFNEIKNNLNQCIDAVNHLVADAGMLAKAAVEGKLDTRADASKHGGKFRDIVDGVNKTLDNVIGPLNVAAEYIDRISKGDIPPRITDNYNGDFNEIKNNLNQCIDAVDALVADAGMLAQAAIEGRLSTRADSTKHNGDFRAIVEGVNETINAIMDPINEATEVLGIMANGDLTTRMEGDYQGEHTILKDSINSVQDSLSTLIKQVNDAVQSAASAALQITSTAESLAASSEEQSAQADEVASAVEEMSRTVTENAMAANRTADVAKKNGSIATDGGTVVGQTVTKMRDIAGVVKQSADNIEKLGESSKQIGEIISVIDDIADQTNLLALNAAIEAARAGEQGRGFAVVADEVRKLAERTTEATKQIAVMIKGIQSETQEAVIAMKKGNDEVSSGISLADRAGSSLKEIVVSTQDVIDMINQIAAASEEQSSTSEQISKNVSSISQVTGESTKRIQDIAHSSDDLSKLTEHLKNLIDQFKITDDMNNYGGFQNKSMKKFVTQKKHLPPGTFH